MAGTILSAFLVYGTPSPAFAAPLTETTIAAFAPVSFELPAEFDHYSEVTVTGLPGGLAYDSATRTTPGSASVSGDFTVSIVATGPTRAHAPVVPLHVNEGSYMNEPPLPPEDTSFLSTLFSALAGIFQALFKALGL